MHTTEGVWLSITDYSTYKKVSISTIRRHIKANVLKYKEENGKYFIYVPSTERLKLREEEETLRIKLENEMLKIENRKLREDIHGLKMLVDLYESKMHEPKLNSEPPELPKFL